MLYGLSLKLNINSNFKGRFRYLILYSVAKAAAHFCLYVKHLLLKKDPSAISNTEILDCYLI